MVAPHPGAPATRTPRIPRATRAVPPRPAPAGRRVLAGVAALAALPGLLAACSGGDDGVADAQARAGAARTAVRSGADCLAPQVLGALGFTPGTSASGTPHPDAPDAGEVPDGFSPVSAVLCTTGETLTDASGRWAAVTATRLEGDVAPLVDALTTSVVPAAETTAAACGTGVPRSDLWLVDALGAAVRAALPGGGCGVLPAEVAEGLDALDAVDVEHYPVELVDARSTAAPTP
ncbi:hypothetical protein [Cellulomonas sp. Marseille-Q8402]